MEQSNTHSESSLGFGFVNNLYHDQRLTTDMIAFYKPVKLMIPTIRLGEPFASEMIIFVLNFVKLIASNEERARQVSKPNSGLKKSLIKFNEEWLPEYKRQLDGMKHLLVKSGY